MLFNSFVYLLLFLPIMVGLYFTLNRLKLVTAASIGLVLGGLFFYGFNEPLILPILLVSITINYILGRTIIRVQATGRNTRILLIAGIVFDLCLLGYFKYTAFFVENINVFTGSRIDVPKILLPLAISFYTFQQIAFLVDTHRGQVKAESFLDYCRFVCFFPQLIAGPIVRYKETVPQHKSLRRKFLSYQNIATGVLLIALGVFKKVILADTLAVWANYGFDQLESLNTITAWVTSLSYTFQVYFDFSGCIDMAIGSGYLFNIVLPVNFNSPYQALNIQDFWRRWHITLSDWLRDYLFLPIAYFTMNRIHTPKLLKIKAEIWGYSIAAMLTMLLGGLWHGAGWNFLLWGAMHGVALVVYRLWTKTRKKLPKYVSWFLTFQFINVTWVFFRAERFNDAIKVLKGMFSFSGLSFEALSKFLSDSSGFFSKYGIKFYFTDIAPGNNLRAFLMIIASFFIILLLKNSNHFAKRLETGEISPIVSALWVSAFIFFGLLAMFFEVPSQFIYFRF